MPALDKKLKHDIEVVVDRIVVKKDIGNRLPDSIETALGIADGLVIAEFADEKEKDGSPKRLMMSSKFACPVSGFTIPEIEPRLFSFNNPHGACPACDGLGTQLYFDPALVVPDETLTLRKGAIAPWSKWLVALLSADARSAGAALQILAQRCLGRSAQRGRGKSSCTARARTRSSSSMTTACAATKPRRAFEGVIPNMQRRFKETDSAWVREELERFQDTSPCEVVQGLSPEARSAWR